MEADRNVLQWVCSGIIGFFCKYITGMCHFLFLMISGSSCFTWKGELKFFLIQAESIINKKKFMENVLFGLILRFSKQWLLNKLFFWIKNSIFFIKRTILSSDEKTTMDPIEIYIYISSDVKQTMNTMNYKYWKGFYGLDTLVVC